MNVRHMARVRRGFAVPVLAACLVAVACTGGPRDAPRPRDPGSKGTIVVGVSGAFTENQLVAELYAQVLEHAGYTVERALDLRSREASQSALEAGSIDLKPEYLSSLLLFIDPNAAASNDPSDVAARDAALLAPRGIELLTPAPAQDANLFVANAPAAERYDLSTMSSLAAHASALKLGGPPECPQRPFCLPGLYRTYGILFRDFVPLDAGGPKTVEALQRDDVQIGLLFSTDPRIEANGFVPLLDDRHLQNAENITPVIRSAVLTDDVGRRLNEVSARLTNKSVSLLIGDVVFGGRDVPSAARAFLLENGLL